MGLPGACQGHLELSRLWSGQCRSELSKCWPDVLVWQQRVPEGRGSPSELLPLSEDRPGPTGTAPFCLFAVSSALSRCWVYAVPALLRGSAGFLGPACQDPNPVSASSRTVALSKASTFLSPGAPQLLGGGVRRALGVVPSVEQAQCCWLGSRHAASAVRGQSTSLMAFLHQWQRRWWWAATTRAPYPTVSRAV